MLYSCILITILDAIRKVLRRILSVETTRNFERYCCICCNTACKLTISNGQITRIIIAVVLPVFQCMITVCIKSTAIDGCNIIILYNSLRNIAELAVINGKCCVIIILDGVDTAGEFTVIDS